MPSFEVQYDDGLEKYDRAADQAEADLINMGLVLDTRPVGRDGEFSDFPRMPVDLSTTSFSELQRLIGVFTRWYGYAVGQLKRAEGLRNAADKKRTFAWSRIRKLKTGTVQDKDDAVRTDGRFVDVDASYERADALARMLNGIAEGLKRDIDTISRAATVLESRVGTEGRGVTIGRKGRSDSAREAFRSGRRGHGEEADGGSNGRRSALDVFRKRGGRR